MTISPTVLAGLLAMSGGKPSSVPFQPPQLLLDAKTEKLKLAQDDAMANHYAFLNQAQMGMGFMGYPFLSELTQRAEYRDMSERLANEMVRKWIRLKSASDQGKAEEIKIIAKKLKDYGIRDLFRAAAINDGFFGNGIIYADIKGARKTQRELQSPLLLSRYKIPKGSLAGFKIIEPLVTLPYDYNSSDPLAADYYNPRTWFVMGQRVHASRLLFFRSRPVPDLLKPAYNFGGISMSQLAMETVNNWLQTRGGVNKIINSYSTSGIKTKMGDVLQGGEGTEFLQRLALFAEGRDNQGLLLLDKDTEEFFQFNMSLGELSKLQAQAQEHMAAISHMPLIILTGISPGGLNASSEGELRVWYDHVHDLQELLFRANLEQVIRLIQLSEFGAIDDDITFDFEPLWQMDGEKLARIRKSDADAAVELIAASVISAQEVRSQIAKDPDSGYEGLAVDEDFPEPDPALVEGKDPLLAKVEGLGTAGAGDPKPAAPGGSENGAAE